MQRWTDENETHPDDELWTQYPWLLAVVAIAVVVAVVLL